MVRYAGIPQKIFDFENGYLIKSPCRQCDDQPGFPGCSENCRTLDLVQRRLALGVVTTRRFSDLEPYTVLLDEGLNKP